MFKFKPTTITINGDEKLKGYTVEGLDPSIFRGLKIILVKSWDWEAYEATTALSIMPRSYPGGYSNKTRKGTLQIIANHLSSSPEAVWEVIQKRLNYDLIIPKINKGDLQNENRINTRLFQRIF